MTEVKKLDLYKDKPVVKMREALSEAHETGVKFGYFADRNLTNFWGDGIADSPYFKGFYTGEGMNYEDESLRKELGMKDWISPKRAGRNTLERFTTMFRSNNRNMSIRGELLAYRPDYGDRIYVVNDETTWEVLNGMFDEKTTFEMPSEPIYGHRFSELVREEAGKDHGIVLVRNF